MFDSNFSCFFVCELADLVVCNSNICGVTICPSLRHRKCHSRRWSFVLTRENVNRHVSTLKSKQNPSAHAVDTMATSNPNIKHLFLWFHLHFRIKHFLVSTVKTISSSESDISNSKVNKKAAMWISERSLLRVALPSAFGRREILLKIAELNTQISRFQAHNFYNLITAREMN